MLLRLIMACVGLGGIFTGYRTGLGAFLVPYGNAFILFLQHNGSNSFFESGSKVILFSSPLKAL